MIESITIKNVASYDEAGGAKLEGLKVNNFIYGANGSGKTTLSKLIDRKGKGGNFNQKASSEPSGAHGSSSSVEDYGQCKVEWKGEPLQTLVFNRDFVKANFDQSLRVKGIFTLGKENVETRRKIEGLEGECKELQEAINGLNKTLGIDRKGEETGKRKELEEAKEVFENACWERKSKLEEMEGTDGIFEKAFEGYRRKKESFMEKIERVSEEEPKFAAPNLDDLKGGVKIAFSKKLEKLVRVEPLEYNASKVLKGSEILAEKIVGKGDVDIAKMIEHLGNSDWVKGGQEKYLNKSEGKCPFCQQRLPEGFEGELSQYFDETYSKGKGKVEQFLEDYGTRTNRLIGHLSEVTKPSVLPECTELIDQLKLEERNLENAIKNNKNLIEKKLSNLGNEVDGLTSLEGIVEKINEAIEAIDKKIEANNQAEGNQEEAKKGAKRNVFKYVAGQVRGGYGAYKTEKERLDKAISNLERNIEEKKKEKDGKDRKIEKLRGKVTDVKQVIGKINKLLNNSGFSGFMLAKSTQDELGGREEFYQLKRDDGSLVEDTLSEGEANFVAFLYFYHLVTGSTSKEEGRGDCVVVFDDPVSSLDSASLFFVSSLIGEFIKAARENNSRAQSKDKDSGREGEGEAKRKIKQVFVLTHNVYFHKQVTFRSERSRNDAMGDEIFWIVRKDCNGHSSLNRHNTNPIKTSYESLWLEVAEPSRAMPNAMRQIIEYYFKFGGINEEEVISNFDGKDKVTAQSLFSWMHAGSHPLLEDLFCQDDCSGEEMLKVFESIFEKQGHKAHYDMMMKAAKENSKKVAV